MSLEQCNWSVRLSLKRAREQNNVPLADVQGIYLLVDEYDAFTNNYLESPNTVEPHKIVWKDTEVGKTFTSFWSMVKSLCSEGIKKVFITGISPLSLSYVNSGFNIAKNVSFDPRLARLCGLTSSDLEKVLEKICKDDKDDKDDDKDDKDDDKDDKDDDKDDKDDKGDKHDQHDKRGRHLSEMTKSFNGYHFCKSEQVETVYNTETCLAYLQSIVDGGDPETENPPNSEVAEQFLEKFATSESVIIDFEKALQCDKDGNFAPLKYSEWKPEFTLRDLVC